MLPKRVKTGHLSNWKVRGNTWRPKTGSFSPHFPKQNLKVINPIGKSSLAAFRHSLLAQAALNGLVAVDSMRPEKLINPGTWWGTPSDLCHAGPMVVQKNTYFLGLNAFEKRKRHQKHRKHGTKAVWDFFGPEGWWHCSGLGPFKQHHWWGVFFGKELFWVQDLRTSGEYQLVEVWGPQGWGVVGYRRWVFLKLETVGFGCFGSFGLMEFFFLLWVYVEESCERWRQLVASWLFFAVLLNPFFGLGYSTFLCFVIFWSLRSFCSEVVSKTCTSGVVFLGFCKEVAL